MVTFLILYGRWQWKLSLKQASSSISRINEGKSIHSDLEMVHLRDTMVELGGLLKLLFH